MAGTIKRLAGPVALSATMTTNIFNQGSALILSTVRHIHIANKTSAAATFRIFLGATGANAAGTELFFDKTIAAFDVYDSYGALLLTSADFLVGGASVATTLTITIEGEQSAA